MAGTTFNSHSFELLPSEGVGFLRLGLTLYRAMNLLKQNNLHNDLRFIYSSNSDVIILQLINYNLNLIFDSSSQKLIIIEINLNNRNKAYGVKYIYKGEIINNFEFKSIYNRVFGPTYPGLLNEKTHNYYLSYIGIAFKFDNVIIKNAKNHKTDDLIRILTNSKDDFNCSAITIFKGDSWNESSNKIIDLLNLPKFNDKIVGFANEYSINYKSLKLNNYPFQKNNFIQIQSANLDLTCDSYQLSYTINSSSPVLNHFNISFGKTTMQEIVQTFGTPQESIIKCKECNQNNTDKRKQFYRIHNYFSLGFDITYKLSNGNRNGSNVVNKLTIHNNIPNSLEFQKYERLPFILKPWNISNDKQDPSSLDSYEDQGESIQIEDGLKIPIISSNTPFEALKLILPFNDKNMPIFLNRKEYEMNSNSNNVNNPFEVIDYEDDDDDDDRESPVKDNDSVSSSSDNDISVDEDEEFKNWGLSKLFGYKNCVFEVLIDGGLISSLTLF
ncbi:hypothetical protein CANARDRAFT_7893 [[Candida] arabinofermentans NRRL YB-2248]|uniref:Uncharacterized protein n=1 Tax=[Candida] arabinofermentans NRRL YB-2248 TaxID=983967 RepID=A0A1E4T0I5_9ASCO|nr:hypothetical protein CANARDRAFT_7893 [[Candida] arabinofermentans NRRL YB-2248]